MRLEEVSLIEGRGEPGHLAYSVGTTVLCSRGMESLKTLWDSALMLLP